MNKTKPSFTKFKLLPAVIQDEQTGNVLMVGFMNKNAYQETIKTKRVTFWSRSRKKLWQKGETSGNYLMLKKISVDCDRDTILCLVSPTGPTCHTGQYSCFQNKPIEFSSIAVLGEVERVLQNRLKTRPMNSYSASLFKKGVKAINSKIIEEAKEVTVAASEETKERLIQEVTDLWFHTLVLMTYKGVDLEDVASELKKRRQ